MEININNIGLIRDSYLRLNKITVVAGENDTGKSTVSKLIYSIVKASMSYHNEFNDFIINKFSKEIKKIFREYRKQSSIDKETLKYLYPASFERNLRANIDDKESLSEIALNYLHRFREISPFTNYESNKFYKHERALYDIIELTNIRNSNDDLFRIALNKILRSEFLDEISSKFSKRPSQIAINDGVSHIMDFELTNNEISYLRLNDDNIFTDVTYIETPFVVNTGSQYKYRDLGSRESDLLDKLQDVSKKFEKEYEEQVFRFRDRDLFYEEGLYSTSKNIKEIIGGELEYNLKDNEFYFRKGKKVRLKTNNVATGVKSLGIIDMLIANNSLESGSLLIIDEPEVHLHPKWQIEYAKILCELAEEDINILINTHSPYMVEAINYHSKQKRMQSDVSFYTTEKIDSNSSNLIDCTNNLNAIYTKLSEPIEKLIWDRY